MKSRTALVALVCSLALYACKKDKDKTPVCRLATVNLTSPNGNTVYNITYSNNGKVVTIRTTGNITTTKTFTYTGNTVHVNEINDGDGSFESRDSITLDNNGRPVNIRSFLTEDGVAWTNTGFEYDGDELFEMRHTFAGTSLEFTTNVTYLNGNPVTMQTDNVTINYDYLPDEKVQTGDYLEISLFLDFGLSVYPHKNLVKTVDGGNNDITNNDYEFNNDGQITKLTSTRGTMVNTYTYQYQCN